MKRGIAPAGGPRGSVAADHARTPEAPATLHADLVHRMESQHAALSTALHHIDKLTPAWATTANQADSDEQASPEEERTFLSHIPAPIRLLWKVVGRRQYAGYLRLIRTA